MDDWLPEGLADNEDWGAWSSGPDLFAEDEGGGFWSGVGNALSGAGETAADFLKNGGATGLLNAYAADRNAKAAQATAARSGASHIGAPVRAQGIDKRILIGGGIAVAVLVAVLVLRRK